MKRYTRAGDDAPDLNNVMAAGDNGRQYHYNFNSTMAAMRPLPAWGRLRIATYCPGVNGVTALTER